MTVRFGFSTMRGLRVRTLVSMSCAMPDSRRIFAPSRAYSSSLSKSSPETNAVISTPDTPVALGSVSEYSTFSYLVSSSSCSSATRSSIGARSLFCLPMIAISARWTPSGTWPGITLR